MTLRFIHAADLHLDSPLRGLSAYETAPLDRIRGATRQAFSKLVDATIGRRAAFLVLAGDVWDGDWPDIGTGLFFAGEMGRLERAGIRVFLIRGNHDAESRVTKAVSFPHNVHVFSPERPESVLLDELGTALHGQSFARPDVTENLALDYPAAVADRINIGLLHTALEGNANHAHYAPCRLTELQAKGYDYWALGHVHEHAVLAPGPSGADGGTIAYPGVLQGRHVRETGAKGALLVEVGDGGVSLERLILDVVRWHVAEVDISACESPGDVARSLGDALRGLVEQADASLDERLLAVRLILAGRSALHGALSLEGARLREEALAQAAAITTDGLFIEKIQLATQPAVAAEALARRHDAIADLLAVLEQAGLDQALTGELGAHLTDLLKHVPAEVQQALRDSDPELIQGIETGTIAALLPTIRASLIDRLAQA